jgi:hypothetical protein
VRGEENGPFVIGVVLGDRDAFFAEAAGGEPEGGEESDDCDQCRTHAARIILS